SSTSPQIPAMSERHRRPPCCAASVAQAKEDAHENDVAPSSAPGNVARTRPRVFAHWDNVSYRRDTCPCCCSDEDHAIRRLPGCRIQCARCHRPRRWISLSAFAAPHIGWSQLQFCRQPKQWASKLDL